MNATLSFEADKARLVRAIHKSDDVTAQMISKFSGAWKDDRSDDEIINDIYSHRYSKKDVHPNPFDI